MMRGARACSSVYHVYKSSTVENICNSRIRCSVLVKNSSHHVHGFNQVRYLSNEDFRRTLERLKNSGSKVNDVNKNTESVKKKQDVDTSDNVSDRIASETDGSSKGNASRYKNSNVNNEKDSDTQSSNLGGDSQSNSGSSSSNSSSSTTNGASAFSRASGYIRSFDVHQLKDLSLSVYDQVVENTKLAYLEMIGRDTKDSLLKRKVEQAESFRTATREVKSEDDEDDMTDKPSTTAVGPSSIVVVKEPKSAWDSMKDRLQDSPFIQEIIRNSRKFSRTAAETPIGKKASEVGQSVKDKIEDMKEFWETSQNPLVYTLSGVWDTMTGRYAVMIVVVVVILMIMMLMIR